MKDKIKAILDQIDQLRESVLNLTNENVFEELVSLLNSNEWPQATDPNLICSDSDDDKKERAVSIVGTLIEDSLLNKKFLDFGCGEGHCVIAAMTKNGATTALGYDINPHKYWENNPNLFTNNLDEVKKQGPFDVILIYDVIDHVDDPDGILKTAASLLSQTGVIYLRCHPYTSRHAEHIYHDLNKAYIHLVFTQEELKKIIPNFKQHIRNTGNYSPIITYEKYIANAGLEVISKNMTTEPVELFFKTGIVANRIMENAGRASFPDFQCSLQFVDWKLGHAST